MCMWLVNPAVALADLVAPQNDHAALEHELTRVRGARKSVQVPRPAARATNDTAAGLAALLHPSGRASS